MNLLIDLHERARWTKHRRAHILANTTLKKKILSYIVSFKELVNKKANSNILECLVRRELWCATERDRRTDTSKIPRRLPNRSCTCRCRENKRRTSSRRDRSDNCTDRSPTVDALSCCESSWRSPPSAVWLAQAPMV